MSIQFLDFEQPIAELEAKIEELRLVNQGGEFDVGRVWVACEYLDHPTASLDEVPTHVLAVDKVLQCFSAAAGDRWLR